MNSEEHKGLDLQRATPLQKAIYDKDINRVKEIIPQLDAKQLKWELIHSKLDMLSSTSLALKFDRTRQIASYILRFVVDPEKVEEQSVLTWFQLFELTDKMYRHFQAHLTSKRMATVLMGLRPYIQNDELELNELVARPKFFKAAWMLGAKYVPKYHGDSFASHVYWAQNITRPEKRKLFDWMRSVSMYHANPLDFDIQAELTSGTAARSRCDFLMHLPQEKEWDEEGFNLFHCAAYRRKPSSFYGAVTHYSVVGYPKNFIVDMLLLKNVHGITPLSVALIKHAMTDYLVFPKEVTLAIRKIVKTGALELIEPVFNSHVMRYCKPFVYYLYSSGVTPEMFSKAFGDRYGNPFEEALTTHASYQPPSESNAMETYDPTAPSFNIDELLTELVYEIAMLLSPEDMFSLFTVSKKLTKLLRQPNDVFWNKYHAAHYHPLNAPCPSLRQRVILEVKGRRNWQSNKYHDLKLKKHHFSVMDDNWMILSTRNTSLDEAFLKSKPIRVSYHYWNCHTQQMHRGNEDLGVFPSLILSNYNYNSSAGPVYFGDGSLDGKYRIVRGQEVIDCTALEEFLVGRPATPYFRINYELIDHRMFVSERSAIYDPECDKIVGHLSSVPAFHFTARYGTYLPYSKQMLVLNNNIEVELYDLNHNRVATLPSMVGLDRVPVQVDEHTLAYYYIAESHHKIGFFDLRMNQFVEHLGDHIKQLVNIPTVSLNGERVIFGHPTLRIITSWNLRTRRWEFVDDNWFFPSACNQRYLVGDYGDSVIIRDFCSNSIKYD